MSEGAFQVAPLASTHDRAAFHCGSEPLDRYLRTQAGQDVRKRVTSCFVALADERRIAGYYTLSAFSLPLTSLPASVRSDIPRYPEVPAIRMGRLAVDQVFRGQGMGAELLVDALRRAVRAEIAAALLVVDAKDADAAAFYRHNGMIELSESPLTLIFRLLDVEKASRMRWPWLELTRPL